MDSERVFTKNQSAIESESVTSWAVFDSNKQIDKFLELSELYIIWAPGHCEIESIRRYYITKSRLTNSRNKSRCMSYEFRDIVKIVEVWVEYGSWKEQHLHENQIGTQRLERHGRQKGAKRRLRNSRNKASTKYYGDESSRLQKVDLRILGTKRAVYQLNPRQLRRGRN